MPSTKTARSGPRRAVIYARLSRSDDLTGSVQTGRQVADAQAYVKRQRWQLAAEPFIDEDISASRYTRKARPGYKAMIETVERGAADTIVAYHLDRLYRRPAELEALIDLAESRGVLVVTMTGEVDLTESSGRMVARMLVTVAAAESDNTSRRIKRQKIDEARAGKGAGGRGLGYRPATGGTLEVVEAEAELIRQAAEDLLAGVSARSICRQWHEAGINGPRSGGPITIVHLRRLLLSPRLIGVRVHRGAEYPGSWEPILDRRTHERLVAHYARASAERRADAPPRRRPMTGLFRCARCGSPMMRTGGSSRGVRQYSIACRKDPRHPEACATITIHSEKAEAEVIELVLGRTDSVAFARRLRQLSKQQAATDVDKITAELVAAEQVLKDAAEDYGSGRIPRSTFLTTVATAERRRDNSAARLAQEDGHGALTGYVAPGALRKAWETLDDDERRGVLTSIIDHVVVHPHPKGAPPRFTPERLEPIWRV